MTPLLAFPECAGQLDLAVDDINRLVESSCAHRSLNSNLAGSLLTIMVGWLMFGDHSLGIEGIGERIANKRAKERAASSFILGPAWVRCFIQYSLQNHPYGRSLSQQRPSASC